MRLVFDPENPGLVCFVLDGADGTAVMFPALDPADGIELLTRMQAADASGDFG
jgi:hypothetical protein